MTWPTFNSAVIGLLIGIGLGVGFAAASLTYRQCYSKNDASSDAQRQDVLERFRIWSDFWKYFLVSFALVLITTLLGNTLKDRELQLQKAKQDDDLALENAKQTSATLIAENTNLGSFLDRALVDSWQKQYAFASYFSHLTRDADARQRWSDYAKFIEQTQQEASKLEAERTKNEIALSKLGSSNPERASLESRQDQVRSQLDLTKAILQTPISLSIRGVNLVDGGTLYEAGLTIDVDGSPHAYHPVGKSGLDVLPNAGQPGNWFGILTDNGLPSGNPVIQGSLDPAAGFYVCPTGLQDLSKNPKDPRRYVDSETIPYIVVPKQLANIGIKLGDFAAVLNTRNQKLCYAVVAEYGPNGLIGEGSIALAQALGLNDDVFNGGATDGIIYKVFPNSGSGWPKTRSEIDDQAGAFFQKWGGQSRMLTELAGRTNS